MMVKEKIEVKKILVELIRKNILQRLETGNVKDAINSTYRFRTTAFITA